MDAATLTVEQAKDQYLESYKARIGKAGRYGRTAVSYNTVAYDLTKAIAPIVAKDICTLRRSDVELVCGHWMGNGLAPRTAWKLISTFKGLLEWADGDVPCFTMPKGLGKLWQECRPTGSGDQIMPLNAEDLKKVLTVANDQTRLYALLALNAGMYQCDIAQLADLDDQGECLVWKRSKTGHQSNLELRHFVWPETRMLIDRCRRENAFGLLLVNTHGTSLVERRVGQRDRDSISTAWSRACKEAGVSIPFKVLRKWSATAIARLADMDVQRMYRGEVIEGSSKFYVVQAFDQKLTPALQKWHGELKDVLAVIA